MGHYIYGTMSGATGLWGMGGKAAPDNAAGRIGFLKGAGAAVFIQKGDLINPLSLRIQIVRSLGYLYWPTGKPAACNLFHETRTVYAPTPNTMAENALFVAKRRRNMFYAARLEAAFYGAHNDSIAYTRTVGNAPPPVGKSREIAAPKQEGVLGSTPHPNSPTQARTANDCSFSGII